VKVREAEREYLAAEASALSEQLPVGALRDACAEMVVAVASGEIPPELEGSMGDLLTLTLETGRARVVHGRAGERALAALWRETPPGKEAVRGAENITEALTALRGLPVTGIRLTATGPASYAMSISAGDAEINLAFDRDGARLRSVNVGAGGPGE
jgi:hypothetical protein